METVEISSWFYIPIILFIGIIATVHAAIIIYVCSLACCLKRGTIQETQETDTNTETQELMRKSGLI